MTKLTFLFYVALVQKLCNAGWHKWSLQFLDYLGEYKVLPLFLHSQKSPKTHERHHGWKEITRKRNNQTKQNKNKKKQNHLHLWVDLMAVAPTLPIVTWAG